MTVEIPEETEDGVKVVGVYDFAFADANVDSIILPSTLELDKIGDLAFLSHDDIAAVIKKYGKSQKSALKFAANTVQFMGKNNWNR